MMWNLGTYKSISGLIVGKSRPTYVVQQKVFHLEIHHGTQSIFWELNLNYSRKCKNDKNMNNNNNEEKQIYALNERHQWHGNRQLFGPMKSTASSSQVVARVSPRVSVGRCFQTDKWLELSAGLLANVWQRRLNAEASSQSDVAGLCRCTLWKNAFQLRLTLRPTHIHMHRVYNCTLKWVRTSLVSDFVSGIQLLSDNLV